MPDEFREYIWCWICECGQSNKVSLRGGIECSIISNTQNKSETEQIGIPITASINAQKKIICSKCGKNPPSGKILNITLIKTAFYDEFGVLRFSELEFENLPEKISQEEFQVAKNTLAQILDYPHSKITLENPNIRQLLQLLAIGARSERSKNAIQYMAHFFHDNVAPKYKRNHSFLFAGMFLFNGVYTGGDIFDYIGDIRWQKKASELTSAEKREIENMLITIKEIYCVQNLITLELVSGMDVKIHDLYNLLEKFNKFFNFVYNSEIVEMEPGKLLESYRIVRNAIAHSHYIIHNNDLCLLDWDYRKKICNGIIGNYRDIAKEMLYLVAIVSQIIAVYQLFYQNKK